VEEFEIASQLKTSPDELWERVVTPEGIFRTACPCVPRRATVVPCRAQTRYVPPAGYAQYGHGRHVRLRIAS